MHSTLEIFDPRMNSWMLGEPMNNSRGFADAVVVGGKLYVIGGLKRKDEILDTVCNTFMGPSIFQNNLSNFSTNIIHNIFFLTLMTD